VCSGVNVMVKSTRARTMNVYAQTVRVAVTAITNLWFVGAIPASRAR
jgi:hypothetical protein